jgi:hypothetical protein
LSPGDTGKIETGRMPGVAPERVIIGDLLAADQEAGLPPKA